MFNFREGERGRERERGEGGREIRADCVLIIIISFRLSFNLVCYTTTFVKQKTVTDSHDIALHFNPRLKENIIVRNTYQNSQWGDEERNRESPLKAGCDFMLYIVCEERGYRIHINDSEYTFYSHRIPPTSITHLRIKGLLTLSSIRYKSTSDRKSVV